MTKDFDLEQAIKALQSKVVLFNTYQTNHRRSELEQHLETDEQPNRKNGSIFLSKNSIHHAIAKARLSS